jgi:hypothetical protein
MLVPPRSELISLKPIGTGTPLAEGLLSYVIRIAAAHVVLELDLLIRVLQWTRGNSPTLEILRTRSNAKRALMLLICGDRLSHGEPRGGFVPQKAVSRTGSPQCPEYPASRATTVALPNTLLLPHLHPRSNTLNSEPHQKRGVRQHSEG